MNDYHNNNDDDVDGFDVDDDNGKTKGRQM